MFLRKKRRRHGGEDYTYWSLCESVRTARGPRQRVVACLGKLDDAEVNGGGWNEIDALLADRSLEPRACLRGERSEPAARWEQVDVSGVQVERTREFGEVYLALALWRRP